MANRSLFGSMVDRWLPRTNISNSEGAPAYALNSRHALAQYAVTGCLNATFYATAEMELADVHRLALAVDPEFVAKTALYARQRGAMKDMPAFLCAVLSVRSPGLMAEIFDRVIDSPKMLRNFVQIMRSGAVGRKSLGTLPKRLVQDWLAQRSDESLFIGSVGNNPSLADIVRMVHPRPATSARKALYAYLVGRDFEVADLPELVQQFESFKRDPTRAVPDVPFQMLTSLKLSPRAWRVVAQRSSWQTARMNLNTFTRHGVFNDPDAVLEMARKLSDAALISRARAMPYQLLAAYRMTADLPQPIAAALQSAMEIATQNVPDFHQRVVVCPDVSGSMVSAATGYRKGATSAVRCVDVSALVAAAVLRRNPGAEVLAFAADVVPLRLNAADTVTTNAEILASIGGGGTDCSAPLRELNRRRAHVDLVIYISDNQSWIGAGAAGEATGTMQQWKLLKKRNTRARMICIDLVPNANSQAVETADILNIGGFSDAVFEVARHFASGELQPGHWVSEIENQRL